MRVALGARRLDVLGLIMSEAGRLVLFGVVAGLGLSLLARAAASRRCCSASQPNDPLLLGIGLRALLGVIAAVASFLPARRATRVESRAAVEGGVEERKTKNEKRRTKNEKRRTKREKAHSETGTGMMQDLRYAIRGPHPRSQVSPLSPC